MCMIYTILHTWDWTLNQSINGAEKRFCFIFILKEKKKRTKSACISSSKHVVSSYNVVLISSKLIWMHHWKHSDGIYYLHPSRAPHTFNEWLPFHEWMIHIIIFNRRYIDRNENTTKKKLIETVSPIRECYTLVRTFLTHIFNWCEC